MIRKELWIRNIVAFIKQIASAEFQEKGWVKGEVHDYCTFVETMCGLFDDANFDLFLDEKAKELGFAEDQIAALNHLRAALNLYTDKHGCYEDPAIIVNDPEWHKIRELAKEALKTFHIEKYLDPSKDIFKTSLLMTIEMISSRQEQERLWIKGDRHFEKPLSSLMDRFFHSHRLHEILNQYKEYEITEEQHGKLLELYRKLKKYKEKRTNLPENPREILSDPEWKDIQNFAREALKLFDHFYLFLDDDNE